MIGFRFSLFFSLVALKLGPQPKQFDLTGVAATDKSKVLWDKVNSLRNRAEQIKQQISQLKEIISSVLDLLETRPVANTKLLDFLELMEQLEAYLRGVAQGTYVMGELDTITEHAVRIKAGLQADMDSGLTSSSSSSTDTTSTPSPDLGSGFYWWFPDLGSDCTHGFGATSGYNI
eukprot:TRINITY_DN2052_c0_g2_i3.p1 TRINITY_DN2052_c0_g2~~TRINITY_DN2052_c0_g2_i3.p1  ORF type:complete len:175 (+),score=28.98 TRINITY_DN2052_c0_g2_i3:281-805(+)